MSDTPRTKSEAIKYLAGMGHIACDRIEELERKVYQLKKDNLDSLDLLAADTVKLEAAQDKIDQLERELAEARAEIERLKGQKND